MCVCPGSGVYNNIDVCNAWPPSCQAVLETRLRDPQFLPVNTLGHLSSYLLDDTFSPRAGPSECHLVPLPKVRNHSQSVAFLDFGLTCLKMKWPDLRTTAKLLAEFHNMSWYSVIIAKKEIRAMKNSTHLLSGNGDVVISSTSVAVVTRCGVVWQVKESVAAGPRRVCTVWFI